MQGNISKKPTLSRGRAFRRRLLGWVNISQARSPMAAEESAGDITYTNIVVWVIAPDKSSGDAFDRVLKGNGIRTEVDYPKITPRVIGDRMNEDLAVAVDLEKAINKAVRFGHKEIVIACNTLQLWLTAVKIPEGVRVYTTFEAARIKYPNDRPVWLGTTVSAREIHDFPTLISLGKLGLQDLTQEIIWRVKGVTGSDVGTAKANIKKIKSEESLRARVLQLLDGLKNAGIHQAIMGCTELPIAVESYANPGNKKGITLIDPAQLLAEMVGKV